MKNLTVITLALLLSLPGMAQLLVKGKVTDETGRGLSKVYVRVIHQSVSSHTAADGSFSIQAVGTDTLIFSAKGYQTKKLPVNNRSFIPVTLSPDLTIVEDAEVLDECIVVGFGAQKRASTTGAVSYAVAPAYFTRPEFNTENYSTIHESGFKEVIHNPLSTFSIDVDRASYTNIRRFLNLGQMPPVDAVRIEEMINYFNYNYEKPEAGKPYSINTELTHCPWRSDHYLLMVGLQAKEIDKTILPPSNLVFLIDVSGSMQAPNKLPLVKSSMTMLVNELRPNDRVAIVVYAGAAGPVLNSTAGNQKQTILSAIDKLEAGGSTAGGAGLKLAYKIARENFISEGNNRIILTTDGDFNVGVSSTSEMERFVENERESGIFMTVLGFGMGNYKDDKMETIADKGNGNYAYIDNLQEAQKVLVKEFGGTLFTVAKDVKLQLEFNPQHVKAYRLIGYENRLLNNEDFKDDKKDAGEMGMGHSVTALYELIPAGSEEKITGTDELKYQSGRRSSEFKYSEELVTVKTRYKLPDGHTSYPIDKIVPTKVSPLKNSSENIRFASAVAGFGMLLRNSEYKGTLTHNQVEELAKSARDQDEDGYRGEFIRLIKVAKSLSQVQSFN